ncbi:hypothetical protein ABW20_dc0102156 [Dactylellina cionopaga]|nr:hypothetical protein ABW20_dc0102156 [Dactylellina cionopaga]
MSIPSDFSFSSFNPESDIQPPEDLDDIPEENELQALEKQLRDQEQFQDSHQNLPQSEDIREAIEATNRERTERLVKAGVVIQHTIPKGISLGYRSDFEFPESPSKRYNQGPLLDRSQYTDITFFPSSQGAQIPPSSPPMMAASSPLQKSAAEDMDANPFTMEEMPLDAGDMNPFDMQDDTPALSKENGTATLGSDNPFSIELEEDNRQEESIFDKAYSNPFDIEENLDDVPAPRLPPKSSLSNKPLDKENQEPGISVSTEEGMPFTLEDTITSQSTAAPPSAFDSHSHTSIPQLPQSSGPKPNKYTRVKVRFSDGEIAHLLQHPPSRLKIYRNSLVNQQHVEELEVNPSLPRSQRKYYGIDIYHLKEAIKADAERALAEEDAKNLTRGVEALAINAVTYATKLDKNGRKLLWTEKYRAKRFTDLLGDERTHRHVLRWLKGWESLVFGATSGKKTDKAFLSDEQRSRKILLVTGPPGLGKTTMAHVLARQAGYEPLEINASDDRTASVVKNRIKDVVGTETVHMGDAKRGKPVCVVIDEIDGVTGEGGGGDGGFIKALVDLIEQDRRNSGDPSAEVTRKKSRKGSDRFRFLRPIIAVCNDLYAPSLRTLRPLCEVVYTKRPPLGLVCGRLKDIFEREGVEGDTDAIRRLVELESGHGTGNSADFMAEWSGDVRGVIVAGEWICGRLRSAATKAASDPILSKNFEMTSQKRIRMTKKWVEEEFNNGGGLGANDGASSGGRGNGVREVVERVFLEEDSGASTYVSSGSGSKKPSVLPGTSAKSRNIQRLRSFIEASGEFDKIMTDCFAKYPAHPFHDDPRLTKPNKAYEWIFMHDLLNSRVFGSNQDYELTPYLSTPLLGLHTLFATPAATSLKGRKAFGKKGGAGANTGGDEDLPSPFTGTKADFEMREAQKATMSMLNQVLGILPHSLVRAFKPLETIAYELAPWLVQIVQPKVNPVLVGGKDGPGVASVRRDVERTMVERAVEVLAECNVGFEKLRVEGDSVGRGGGWIFRMEPAFDSLSTYKTFTQDTPTLTTRYAVRQVLDQELRKFEKEADRELKRTAAAGVKRDFFGRIVIEEKEDEGESGGKMKKRKINDNHEGEGIIAMTTSTSNLYNEAQAAKAVAALKAHLATQKTASSKQSLFDAADESDVEDGTVGVADPDLAFWLVVTTKKFFSHDKKTKQERMYDPSIYDLNPFSAISNNLIRDSTLPNPYLTNPSATFTICLITKDPSTYYRSLLPHLPYHPSSLTIISPSKLKTNYKSFEARRQLERAHDVFLADDRVIPLLPGLLGKSIYRRSSKVPIPIKLSKIETPAKDAEAPKSKLQSDAEKLQKEIEKVIKATYFIPSPSPSQNIKVGIRSQSPEELAQNVTAVVEHLTTNTIKNGWKGVRSLHLKAADTVALPIWLTERIYDDEDVLTEEEIKRIEHLKTKEGKAERQIELKEKKKEKKKEREERKKNKRNWDSDAESGEDQYFVRKIKPAESEKSKKRKAEETEEPASAKKAKVDEKEVVDTEKADEIEKEDEEGGVKLPEPVDLSEQAKKLKIGEKRIAPPAPALKTEKKKDKKAGKSKSESGKVGIKEKLKRKASKTEITATKGKKSKAYQ